MRVRILQDTKMNLKKGDEKDLTLGIANYLIRIGHAESIAEKKVKTIKKEKK